MYPSLIQNPLGTLLHPTRHDLIYLLCTVAGAALGASASILFRSLTRAQYLAREIMAWFATVAWIIVIVFTAPPGITPIMAGCLASALIALRSRYQRQRLAEQARRDAERPDEPPAESSTQECPSVNRTLPEQADLPPPSHQSVFPEKEECPSWQT